MRESLRNLEYVAIPNPHMRPEDENINMFLKGYPLEAKTATENWN